MVRKLYYANVTIYVVNYFEEKLRERKDKIKIVSKSEQQFSRKNNEPYITYILEAEEGIIDPRWELTLNKRAP